MCFKALEGIEVRLERAFCFCNPKYCISSACGVKFISRTIANLNMNFITKRNLTAITYRMRSFYKFSNNEYRPMLIDVTVNYCEAEQGIFTSPLHKYLKTVWINYSNMFQTCPIPPGEYYIKNFNFRSHHLPSIAPAGRYLMNTTIRVQNNDIFINTSVYFYIANHGVLDLDIG